MRQNRSNQTLLLVMFAALEVIVAFVPVLGSIPVGGFMGVSTLSLPVVMAGALLGTGPGALVGLLSGVCRLLSLSFLSPDPVVSPLFTPFAYGGQLQPSILSLAICLIPPIVVGLTAAVLFRALGRIFQGDLVSLGLAGAGGVVAGWMLTWLGIFLVFRRGLSAALGVPFGQILLAHLVPNLLLEAAAALLLCACVGTLLYKKFIVHN